MTLVIDVSCKGIEGSRRISLEDNETLEIGRANDELELSKDRRLSRRHFLISFKNGEIELSHLSKTNPTLVAPIGKGEFTKLRGKLTLTDNCRIMAGSHRFILTLESFDSVFSPTLSSPSLEHIWFDMEDDEGEDPFAVEEEDTGVSTSQSAKATLQSPIPTIVDESLAKSPTPVNSHVPKLSFDEPNDEPVSSPILIDQLSSRQQASQLPASTDASPVGFTAEAPTILPSSVPSKLTDQNSNGFEVGNTLGGYELIDKIGVGGMGQVFKARHRRMKRVVALKKLPDEFSGSRELLRRFEREVEAAAKLDHPNIVTAFDAGEEAGIHFLVMQFIDGSDVSDLISKQGVLDPRQAVDLTLQAARGLAYAHSRGIIHRDIKPANLLVDKNGTLKILDMGLARMQESAAQSRGPQTELTQIGAVMGTVDYLAPEQAIDSRTADNRSDIYSLGCTFYQMLTGTKVFQGETDMQVILAHCDMPIPVLSERVVGLPHEFNTFFEKMLAKDPADRFQDMNQCIAALERLRPLTEGLDVEVVGKKQAAKINYRNSINAEHTSNLNLIQPPAWTSGQIKIGFAAALTILGIGLSSMYASYCTDLTTDQWLTRFDELKGTPFQGYGFEIGCTRILLYVSCLAYVFWKSFRRALGQIFDFRYHTKKVQAVRILLCLIALAFGSFEAFQHLSADKAPRQLLIESGIENPSGELVAQQLTPYAAFLPYSLVIYVILVPLLIVIPFASALLDFPKIRTQATWLSDGMAKSNFKGSQVISLFRRFESNCQAVCERYLSCTVLLLVAINFECWIGRYTLSQSGFELGVKGMTACGVAAVACLIWILGLYINTNQSTVNTLVSNDSPDSASFRNAHNGVTFLKWLLVGSSTGLLTSLLTGLLIIWIAR